MTRWTIESKGGIEYGVYEGATEIEIPITDEQIDELRTEAGAAGDIPMVAICDVALDEVCDEYPGAAEWQAQDMRRALSMDREAARLECARVIAEARAQEDE